MSSISYTKFISVFFFAASLFLTTYTVANAATLRLSPETGVYTAGQNFTVRVVVNTQGASINASDAKISFDPNDLSVVNVSRASSIFSLWTQEPTFSNVAGSVSYGGGAPSGYVGNAGTVMSITFRAKHAGTTNVVFSSGSVLAADGRGTNVISGMQTGSYTIGAAVATPPPEYIAPPNTPAAPNVKSSTHPDPNGWYKETTAELSWSIPDGVSALRTLLDNSPGTIPTVVYDPPINTKTIEDLEDGKSYFHIQFRNAEGWGRVAHYRLGVDTKNPTAFSISVAEDNNPGNPETKLHFDVKDETSGVSRYLVQLDGGEPVEYIDEEKSGFYTTPALEPGHHAIVVEAFDEAGNNIIGSFSFDVASFDAPVFTEYPSQISEEVIPVIRGATRPNAKVIITMTQVGRGADSNPQTHEIVSDPDGVFTLIPDGRLALGVYELRAVAVDEFGAQSERSETIRIAVQQPGYINIGNIAINVLSVLIPLVALIALLILVLWYGWHRAVLMRKRVRKEVTEAEQSLAHEFDDIVASLKEHVEGLKKNGRGKLTKTEASSVNALTRELNAAEKRVKKEIADIEKVIGK